jgi:hypothetical protein
MADAVASIVILNSDKHYVIHLTNISDGTGESAVVKVDKSGLLSATKIEPTSLDIDQIRWSIQGFTSVRLLWDHTTDDLAMVLTGSGFEDFRSRDLASDLIGTNGLKDPRSTGGTGDLLLTTNGGISGSSYDITIWLRKNTV